MYNYSFELTYRHQGGEAGSQYQADILGVFGMETFDEKAINDEVEALYSKVKPYMGDIVAFVRAAHRLPFALDEISGFMTLFSWHYFDKLHECLRECNDRQTKAKKSATPAHDALLNTLKKDFQNK